MIFGGSIGSLLGGYFSDLLMRSSEAAKAYVIAGTQLVCFLVYARSIHAIDEALTVRGGGLRGLEKRREK